MANSIGYVRPESRKLYSGPIHAGDLFSTGGFVWDYDGNVFTSRSYSKEQIFTMRFSEREMRVFWARANPCGRRLVGPLEDAV